MIFEEVKIYDVDMFTDFRGDIFTSYKEPTFEPKIKFVHDKFSSSRKNVLRGLHGDFSTWKLVSCLHGEVYFVVVDNRKDSPSYLEWDWMILDDKRRKQVLLPPGFANGFYVLSDHALFGYKLSYPDEYADIDEQFALKWNDEIIGIHWPCSDPILQKRDSHE
jgi:dTDP-4-dehydrorhamnose 3,5-epimerase